MPTARELSEEIKDIIAERAGCVGAWNEKSLTLKELAEIYYEVKMLLMTLGAKEAGMFDENSIGHTNQ